MLRRFLAGIEYFFDPLVRHPLAEKIRHRADKNRPRLFPLLRLVQLVAVEGWCITVWIRLFYILPHNFSVLVIIYCVWLIKFMQLAIIPQKSESVCNPSRIAVFAPMQAPCDRVPARVEPVNLCFISHLLHPIFIL